LDEQLKIRGFRIEPGEVEAALAEHPTVREAVVLAHDGRPGEARLVSYVVPYERAAPMLDDLRKFLKGRLPEYMLPSALMVLDELPHTPHGKVDRRALPAPEGLYPEREGVFTAPCDPLEDKLADVWSEVLGLEQVGIHDDFFELGGHSLLATQVVSRVRTVFGIELPVRCIFEEPTVAELAKKIIQRQAEEADHEDPRRILAKREELL
jgi:acyl carrier protein